MSIENQDDFFNDQNMAQSQWFKFATVGDRIKGTYVARAEKPGRDGYPDQIIYVLRCKDGEFNVPFAKGKDYIHSRMKNARFGQEVGFLFKEEVPSQVKGKHPAKNILVYHGKMDPSFSIEMGMSEAAASPEVAVVEDTGPTDEDLPFPL